MKESLHFDDKEDFLEVQAFNHPIELPYGQFFLCLTFLSGSQLYADLEEMFEIPFNEFAMELEDVEGYPTWKQPEDPQVRWYAVWEVTCLTWYLGGTKESEAHLISRWNR